MPSRKGFTLIELLIVISIIGILATFVVASFTSAQAKGRDSKRKADLDALKKSLELAKSDSTGGSYYPGCDSGNTCIPSAISTNPDLSPSYIGTVPTDPKGGGSCASGLAYCYNPACSGNYCASTYTMTACLENANEPVGANVTAVAAGVCTSLRQYSVVNP